VSSWHIAGEARAAAEAGVRFTADQQRAYHESDSLRRDEDLAEDIARLKLVCEALWSLCSDRLGITDDELRARIVEIDRAEDGLVDGRHHPRPRACPGCGAMVPAGRDTCQYCATAVPGRNPLD
jgi:hypothetical protein